MAANFDIIFSGGGTTACVVAGRLAAADPSLRILVVESGPHTHNVPAHVQPCRFMEHLAPTSTTMSFHVGKPSEHLNGRPVIVPCGRCVGGGSAVNFMVYVRAAASDYDDWAKLGNDGWSSSDLLPLIKKLETFTPQADQPTHGYSGPIKVSPNKLELGLGRQFLDTARKYDPDRAQVYDNNDLHTPDAYAPTFRYIDPKNGTRCDAASRYLYPHSENPNLQILAGKRVKRVIIENGRAIGIEYTDATPNASDNEKLVIAKASKLVVVSAGAFGSPAILERSGIGAKPVLEKHNVPLIVDLPGVGENYQDHIGAVPVYHAADIETLDDVWGDPKNLTTFSKEWESAGTGKISHNGFEAMAKVRPTTADLASMGPPFQSRWETFFQPNPDKPLAMILPIAGSPAHIGTTPIRKWIDVSYYLLYPESVGNVHITSGENANAPLDFDPHFSSKPSDVSALTLMYKKTRELARRMPSYRGELHDSHPSFPAGSDATCREVEVPVPIDAPDIMYSAEDDLAIEDYHRNVVRTTFHSMGTCAMKPREDGGVVDARLNVHGVQGLKVADLSICPTNVGNNTYSTALLIGEKAAMIIAEDLGVKISLINALLV